MPFEVAEGTTANLDFTLTADGAAVNLSGGTVTILLKDKDGATVDTTGDVSVITASEGKVRYAPDSTDLVASVTPHRARFKFVDSGGLISYFPSKEADPWTIRPV